MSEPKFGFHVFRNMRIPKDPTKNIQGTFYHGIIHGSYYGWYAEKMIRRNMDIHRAPGMLASPNYHAYLYAEFAKCHIPIRDQEIKDLRHGGQSRGGLTPRAIECLNKATHPLELEFEVGRRKISPESPSRLDCLYVADNEDTIRQMFLDDANLIILKVNIVEALRFTKADYKWYDKCYAEWNPQYIENYWRSIQCDEGANNWEYLVDGLIMVNDPTGERTLRKLWSEEEHDEFD